MRTKIFAAFIAAIILVGLISGAAFAEKIITKVDVVNKADRAVICVQGNTALSMMPFSTARGTYLGFQVPFRLGDKGRIVPIHGGRIHSVRFSNFKARPAITRFVVNTAGIADYSTEWSPDKRRLEISVWKFGGAHKTIATPASVVKDTAKPVETARVVDPAPVCAPVPVRLSDDSRKVYAALRTLGQNHKTAWPSPFSRSRWLSLRRPDSNSVESAVKVAPAAPAPLPLSEDSRKAYAATGIGQSQRWPQPRRSAGAGGATVVVASAAIAIPVESAVEVAPEAARTYHSIEWGSRKAYAALRTLSQSQGHYGRATAATCGEGHRNGRKQPRHSSDRRPAPNGWSLSIPQPKSVEINTKPTASPWSSLARHPPPLSVKARTDKGLA